MSIVCRQSKREDAGGHTGPPLPVRASGDASTCRRTFQPGRGGPVCPPALRASAYAFALILGLVVTIAFGSSVALADDPTAEQQLQVERQLGCPICTNLPLNVCDNQICVQMKGVIHQKLAAGETPSQVIDFFVARYGEGVLLTPPNQGFSLVVWYAPAVAVLFGGLLVWMLLRESLRRQKVIQNRLSLSDADLDGYRSQVRRDVDGLGKPL